MTSPGKSVALTTSEGIAPRGTAFGGRNSGDMRAKTFLSKIGLAPTRRSGELHLSSVSRERR